MEEEKEGRSYSQQCPADGGCESIDSLGNGCRANVVNGSQRLMKGVGGGRNDGRTRVTGQEEEGAVVIV